MAPTEDHLEKAEHNERFADFLYEAKPDFYDWVVTGAFYSAVHYVEAALARRQHHSQSHQQRDEGVRLHLRTIYHPYRQLKDLSMRARYQLAPVNRGGHHLMVKQPLARIRAAVLEDLGK